MTRKAKHAPDDILDATRGIVLTRGVQHATIGAISSKSGAPVGSLYHHFGSRDELVAELWMRAVGRSQAMFLAALAHPDPEQASVAAALSIYDFASRHPEDAKLLMSFRREDLLHDARSPRLLRALGALNQPLEQALIVLTRRLFGNATRDKREQTMLAVIDIPFGALRRHLVAGGPLPQGLRSGIEAAVRAVLRVGR